MLSYQWCSPFSTTIKKNQIGPEKIEKKEEERKRGSGGWNQDLLIKNLVMTP